MAKSMQMANKLRLFAARKQWFRLTFYASFICVRVFSFTLNIDLDLIFSGGISSE